MNSIKSFLGRRQFLKSLAASGAVAVFGGGKKIFGLLGGEGIAGAAGKPNANGKKAIKACVVYYSATGSTAKIAKAIYKGMKTVMDCDISPINKIDPKAMAKYDVIAVGGPIWFYRDTANLKLFIYEMPRMTGKLCIPFCSHGSEPSGYFYSLSRTILQKGLTIIGWNDWYGSVFHVLHMPKPYLTDGHPDHIDLAGAEAFGKSMAGRAQKIYAGDATLIPELPGGPGADPLWNRMTLGEFMASTAADEAESAPSVTGSSAEVKAGQAKGGNVAAALPAVVGAFDPNNTRGGGAPSGTTPGSGNGPGGGAGAPQVMPAGKTIPVIDISLCVFPRCSACADNCPVDAIDFKISTPAGRTKGSSLLVKEACISCGLCQRMCSYDALTCPGGGTQHVIDMKKCTYPKCTQCLDHCPMKSIYLSNGQLVYHKNCEGCDVCWCICPTGAVDIPNLATTHAGMRFTRNHPFLKTLNKNEAKGKFRRLVSLDQVGWDNPIWTNKNLPRIKFKDGEDWPEMKDNQGNVYKNYYD
jgi:formate hydrogenlyase subunit 6/NADH:ubiquinone oxidoreductase subunit I/flavodoxin